MAGDSDPLLMELTALGLLERSAQPVGSARLAGVLREAGIPVAEATAGRYLRRLDERGLTRTKGPKLGRVITEAGRRRLGELRRLRRQDEHGARVLRAVNGAEVGDLVDLLYVRRAVESEAARLAALRATDEELERIGVLSAFHVREVGEGRDSVEPSMRFHRAVAEASHNRMLVAVGLLLLDPANDPLEGLLAWIALEAGATPDQAADHLRLAEASRRRYAPAAEDRMRAHRDELIRSVEAYRGREGRRPLDRPEGAG